MSYKQWLIDERSISDYERMLSNWGKYGVYTPYVKVVDGIAYYWCSYTECWMMTPMGN